MKPKLLTITELAAEKMRLFLKEKSAHYIRIGVKNGGCAGMEYTMETVNQAIEHDEEVQDKDIKILVAANAVLYLIGSEIDYEISELSSRFVFNNPNQIDTCGCGESFILKPYK